MVGKHCTRCKGGIYTAWRTLDKVKYYHPHCFTCAVCGVILECVKECGVPNLKEIYCRNCYSEYFKGAKGSTPKKHQNIADTEDEILKALTPHENSKRQASYFHFQRSDLVSNQPMGDIASSLEPETIKPGMYEIVPNIISRSWQDRPSSTDNSPPLLSRKDAVGQLTIREKPSNALERKTSRIPRPTSAILKKTVPGVLSNNDDGSKSKHAVADKQTPRGPNSTTGSSCRSSRPSSRQDQTRPPSGLTHRSLSLIHPRTPAKSEKSYKRSVSTTRCSTSTTRLPEMNTRPTSCYYSESGPAVGNGVKRQCAASFSLHVGNGMEKSKERVACTTSRRSLKHDSGIPSTQDILKAIRRGSSELTRIRPPSHLNSQNVLRRNSSVLSPKRSCSITFDCPICMNSLINQCYHSNGPNSSTVRQDRRSRGNVVTACGHAFHRDCLENWLLMKGRNKRCPICSTVCLPENLRTLYLECNVSADTNTALLTENTAESIGSPLAAAYSALRSEYDILKVKYNDVVTENDSYSVNAAIAKSLQSAYEMECRNRLQLQWENKKLMRQIDDLQSAHENF